MAIAWEADIKPGEKLVLLAIADHADGKGVCWPGQELIAEKCNMNRSTVNIHINSLVAANLLFVEKRRSETGRQAPSIYRVNLDYKKPDPESDKTILEIGNPEFEITTLETQKIEKPALENPALEKQAARVGNSNTYTFNEPKKNPQLLCADPSGSPHAVIKIPLNIVGTYHDVFEDDIKIYSELYPAVDVLQQLRNMVGWCNANPTKRKTKDGIKRFINSWLTKDQDRGGSKSPRPHVNQQMKPVPEYVPPEKRGGYAGDFIDSTAKIL